VTHIKGLFLDYDGTLSPLNTTRENSRIPPHLETMLNVMRKSIPIGIVTMKDLPFIVPRTVFADAWCAIAGLEMKIGPKLFVARNIEKHLEGLFEGLIFAKQNLIEGAVIEEKCNHLGLPLAFCVDWRQVHDEQAARAFYEPILNCCHSLPVHVIEYSGKPYFDVYIYPINKGSALRKLKDKLKVSQGALYMGDSVTDNSAFGEADISIGVAGERKPEGLNCKYWIKFDDVAFFFSNLYKNRFSFSPDLPGIREYSAA
jgi:hydroxymethylpyrimidine pyrophosphatase-like HAD family hydrolase